MEFSWKNVLQNIEGRISKPSYETWLKNTEAEISGNILTVFAPNSFAMDWLENHYQGMILEIVKELTGETYIASFKVEANLKNDDIEDNSSQFANSHNFMDNRNNLIKKQQEKIEELEKRIQVLEQKLEV